MGCRSIQGYPGSFRDTLVCPAIWNFCDAPSVMGASISLVKPDAIRFYTFLSWKKKEENPMYAKKKSVSMTASPLCWMPGASHLAVIKEVQL